MKNRMTNLLLIGALLCSPMLVSCEKDEADPPAPVECPEAVQYVPLDEQRTIYATTNTQISYGGQLIESMQVRQGDAVKIFLQDCGSVGTVRVTGLGDYSISCNDQQVFPWMIEWIVP